MGKSRFVVFANFHGVNILDMANFKDLQNCYKFLKNPTIGFDEPAEASSSPSGFQVSIRKLARQHP